MSQKLAIVTGGNKGIGFAIVKGLCEDFNGVVYLTARDVGRGESAVKELEKLGFKPKFHQLDVTDDKSVNTFKEFITKTYKGIDVLVNNAAIAFHNDSPEPFGTQAEETIRVNYLALLRVCNSLFPLLNQRARVVNLSSCMGHLSKIPSLELRGKLSDPGLTIDQLTTYMNNFVRAAKDGKNAELGWGNSAYIVSKVGVSALTRVQQKLFDEEKPNRNVAVNSVHPGYVNTDMTRHTGPLNTEEGAVAPLFLALMPKDDKELKGEFVWRDKTVVEWTAEDMPAAY